MYGLLGYSLGQRLVGTITALSLCLANAGGTIFFFFLNGHHLYTLPLLSSNTRKPQREAFTCIQCPSFVGANQGMPLDHLALVEKGTCIPGSHRTVTVEKTVPGRLPVSEHCKDRRHTQSFRGKAYLLVLELWPKGQAPGLAHIWRPTELLLGNIGQEMPSLRSPVLQCYSSPVSPRKELIH